MLRAVSIRHHTVVAALSLPIGCALLGCQPGTGGEICARPESAEPTDYTGGTTEDGIYMSSEWDGDLLSFHGGAYYRIHHDLGVMPRQVDIWLGFSRNGLAGGSLSEAAGNQAEVKAIDESTITLLNGSCADYWMLVVVE
jgi:hypothetical protein